MHIGPEQFPGGRLGEPAANELSESLNAARPGTEKTQDRHAGPPGYINR